MTLFGPFIETRAQPAFRAAGIEHGIAFIDESQIVLSRGFYSPTDTVDDLTGRPLTIRPHALRCLVFIGQNSFEGFDQVAPCVGISPDLAVLIFAANSSLEIGPFQLLANNCPPVILPIR